MIPCGSFLDFTKRLIISSWISFFGLKRLFLKISRQNYIQFNSKAHFVSFKDSLNTIFEQDSYLKSWIITNIRTSTFFSWYLLNSKGLLLVLWNKIVFNNIIWMDKHKSQNPLQRRFPLYKLFGKLRCWFTQQSNLM